MDHSGSSGRSGWHSYRHRTRRRCLLALDRGLCRSHQPLCILAGGLAALVLGIIALVSSFSTGLMCIGGGLALVALAVLLGLGLTLLIRKMVQLPAKLAHRSKDKGGNNYE